MQGGQSEIGSSSLDSFRRPRSGRERCSPGAGCDQPVLAGADGFSGRELRGGNGRRAAAPGDAGPGSPGGFDFDRARAGGGARCLARSGRACGRAGAPRGGIHRSQRPGSGSAFGGLDEITLEADREESRAQAGARTEIARVSAGKPRRPGRGAGLRCDGGRATGATADSTRGRRGVGVVRIRRTRRFDGRAAGPAGFGLCLVRNPHSGVHGASDRRPHSRNRGDRAPAAAPQP